MGKEKPYRVIIRSHSKAAIQRAVAAIAKISEYENELRVGEIHRG